MTLSESLAVFKLCLCKNSPDHITSSVLLNAIASQRGCTLNDFNDNHLYTANGSASGTVQ